MPDHFLISRVQNCTNGTNVHVIGNALHVYVSIAELLDIHSDMSVRERLETFERELRAFCCTGSIKGLSAMLYSGV